MGARATDATKETGVTNGTGAPEEKVATQEADATMTEMGVTGATKETDATKGTGAPEEKVATQEADATTTGMGATGPVRETGETQEAGATTGVRTSPQGLQHPTKARKRQLQGAWSRRWTWLRTRPPRLPERSWRWKGHKPRLGSQLRADRRWGVRILNAPCQAHEAVAVGSPVSCAVVPRGV